MNLEDQDQLVKQVVDICQTDEKTARSYLELSDWNLNDAIENVLNAASDESASDDYPIYDKTVSDYKQLSEPSQTVPSTAGSSRAAQVGYEPRIATISSLENHDLPPHESDDEDFNSRQAFYVGGAEHGGGGQQVLGPPKLNNPESYVQSIFRAAREGGAETLNRDRASDLMPDPTHHQEAFSGTGYRLGESQSDPIVKVPGKKSTWRGVGLFPHEHVDETEEDQDKRKSVVVKMWNDGFSLDDGPLRLYTDPASVEFMIAVKQGRIPSELIASSRNREVHILLEDHHNEAYQELPAPKLKPFSGVGRVLGNPTPKVITSEASASTSDSSSLPPRPKVDQLQPTTQLQIRSSDGSRMVIKLNHHHTIEDLRAAIVNERPELASLPFSLQTTFPRIQLKDNSATLKDANLLNSTLLITKC